MPKFWNAKLPHVYDELATVAVPVISARLGFGLGLKLGIRKVRAAFFLFTSPPMRYIFTRAFGTLHGEGPGKNVAQSRL